ncbi:hybrid sensor histidine kinase/response regulator [Pseudoduganella chitinolytica]|uniref:histidine kinase n=1 Tax=Pseudoduganella chitinolytica TaxID=34070 RepID=A0ABY8BK49_9BURK|nr:PAS domain S-box protein [Pseudoduganella chitinolytica]WEF35062.1 PAS domain S-box protein [Pseudoduganella chitinolytica]
MILPTGPGDSPRSQADQPHAAQEARERARLSAGQLAAALGSISDGLAVLDRDWLVTYLNRPADDMLRAPSQAAEDVVGRVLWQAFPHLAGTLLETQLRLAQERRQNATFELFHASRQRWIEVRAFPFDGGVTCTLHDIHQRKQHERALRENSNRLQVALAAGKLGDWTWTAANDVVTCGPRAAEIFDLPPGEATTWSALQERIVASDRAGAQAAFLQAFTARSDFSVECRIVRDGGSAWLSVAGHGYYDDGGRLLGMTGMVQDISERKAAEDTLRHSEEQLRALADSIPQLAWIAHHDGRMVWYNRRWHDYTGVQPDELEGDGWSQVYAPDCIDAMVAHWQASLESGQPFEMEIPIRGADGQYRWFLTRANPVRDASGQMLRWFGTSTDVDQVKRAQEALRDETNILEMLNSTGNALARHRDLQPLLQEVTDAATRILGARFGAFFYRGSDRAPELCTLAGQPPSGQGDMAGNGAALLAGLDLGQDDGGGAMLRCDDLLRQPTCAPQLDPALGRHVRSLLAAPVVSRAGDVVGTLLFGHPEPGMFGERSERIIGGIAAQAGVAIDNARLNEAARRAAEERIALLDRERSARAEAERSSQMKDEFLATLSHELRTPLNAILGWSQMLRRGNRGEADLQKGLQTIERNARAQAQLIEDLLDMSRIMSGQVLLEMQGVPPATIVDAAIEAVRPAAQAKQIVIEREFAPCALIAADPGRLQQVVWNLLSNAIKFTPPEGRVRVTVRERDGQAEIGVSDTGIGIGAEFLGHVFDRFRQADASTTRRHGGLGLGLSIVKHLVEQHGGTVTAASAGEGQGAAFTVSLPLAGDLPLGERPQRPAGLAAPGARAGRRDNEPADLRGLRVLVVDDEPDGRDLIKRVLADRNAEVTTAATAGEALALLPRVRAQLLLSDIGMPDMDGFELLERVRALGPAAGGDLPAIALTAFAQSEDRLRALEAGFLDHISKPVEPAELIAAVALVAAQCRAA